MYRKYFGNYNFIQSLGDILAAKWILLGSIGTAFFLGFVLMILLRFLAKPIIIVSLTLLIAGTGVAGWLLF
jgi:hypothetical protein